MQLYATLGFLAECAKNNLALFNQLPEHSSSDVAQVC